MDAARFWQMIDASRVRAGGDPEKQMELLRGLLTELPEQEILAFDRLFNEHWVRAYTWDLWGAAYVIGGGCSDDGFMDFRGWLIAKGRQVYEAALADPESLVESMTDADDNGQIEGFQYVAMEAWEAVTGEDWSDAPRSEVESPAKPSGEPWAEDEVAERLPRLTARFF